MKKILLLTWMACFVIPVFSQNVTESLMNLRRKYSPMFSKTSAMLSMEFTKNYSIGAQDTTFYFLISLNETDIELQSVSIGASVFGVGNLIGDNVGVGADYVYNKSEGEVVFEYGQFMEFYNCVNDVYRLVGTKNVLKDTKYNTICSCAVGGIVFGGEFLPDKSQHLKFYLKIGETSFSMTKTEFDEIIRMAYDSKQLWDVRP